MTYEIPIPKIKTRVFERCSQRTPRVYAEVGHKTKLIDAE